MRNNYNFAIIPFMDEHKQELVQNIKTTLGEVSLLSKEHVISLNDNKFYGFLILIDENSNVGEVCEIILHLKKTTDAFLWILSDTLINKVTRSIYFRLGVDGIFHDGLDLDEISMVISNAMDRFRKYFNSYKENSVITKSITHPSNIENGFKLVPSNYSVLVCGKEVGLTNLEFLTVDFLYRHAGEAVSYKEIYQSVWNNDDDDDKRYRVFNLIFHLRKKIEKDESNPRFIKTVRSKGYMLQI